MNIFKAAKNGDIVSVQDYIKKGARVNGVDEELNTPLYYASKNNHTKLMKLLVCSHGARINQRLGTFETTVLIEAVRHKRLSVIRTAIEIGADVNKSDFNDRTPLQLAVKNNLYDIVALLLTLGATPDTDEKNSRSSLSIAVKYDRKEIASLLRFYGANHGISIALAEKERSILKIQLLLRSEPDIYVRIPKIYYWEHDDKRFDTLTRISIYEYACRSNHVDIDGVTEVRTSLDDKISNLMIHRLICDNTIAMFHLQLSVYVLLWIFDFLPHVSSMNRFKKVHLIENLNNSVNKIDHESQKKIKKC